MFKIYFKLKASKTKKPLKLPVVLNKLAYNIETHLKRVLKAKVQLRGYPEYKDVVIYTLYTKSGKNKGGEYVLTMF